MSYQVHLQKQFYMKIMDVFINKCDNYVETKNPSLTFHGCEGDLTPAITFTDRSDNMILSEEVLRRYQQNQGYVYLIHAVGTNRYKIGRSINPPARLETLKKQSPYPLQIIECFWTPDAIADETEIHKIFAEHRVYGEWFEFIKPPSDKNEYIGFVKNTFDYGRPVVEKIARDSWDYFLQSIFVEDTNLLEVVSKNRSIWEEFSQKLGPAKDLSSAEISEWFRIHDEDSLTKAHYCTPSITFLYHRASNINTLKSVDYFVRHCLVNAVCRCPQITKKHIPVDFLLCIEAAVDSFEAFLFTYETPTSINDTLEIEGMGES